MKTETKLSNSSFQPGGHKPIFKGVANGVEEKTNFHQILNFSAVLQLVMMF